MSRLSRFVRRSLSRQIIPNAMTAWWYLYGRKLPTAWMEPREWIRAHPDQGRHVPITDNTRSSLPRRRVAGDLGSIDEYVRSLPNEMLRGEWRHLYRGDVSYCSRDEVHVIANGCCVDEAGLAISPDGCLIGSGSHYGFTNLKSDRLNLLEVGYVPNPVCHSGRVALLAGGKGYHGYYHWVMETLPRLRLLQLADIEVDKYYVPYSQPYHREGLNAFGIAADQVIAASSFRHIQADELVIPSVLYGHSSEFECTFLFDRLAHDRRKKNTRQGTRILISRRKAQARRVLNEAELCNALRRLGFQQYFLEDLDFTSQVQLFQSADWVIGPHGAGLTNIVFCRPGTKVIELGTAYRPLTCFHEIAHHRKLDYVFFLASPRNVRIHNQLPLKHNDADLNVDVTQLLATIQRMKSDCDEDWEVAA